MLALLVCTHSTAATPELGSGVHARELNELGQSILTEIMRRNPVIDDPITTAYLAELVDRLRGANAVTTTVPSITVFRARSVNAFVLPGGYMGVNAGLLLEAPNESAFASVLAHELAHLTQRHIERRFARQSGTNLRTIAVLLAGALVARDNPQAARAALYSGVASSVQDQLDYSRENEREADRLGQKFLENANFRSAGMAEMLSHMSRLNALNYSGGLEYLQTHPLTPNRVGEAWDRARRSSSVSAEHPPTPDFELIQQRIAHLINHNLPRSRASAYGDALGLLEQDPQASLAKLNSLPPELRDAQLPRLLRARALMAAGQSEAAAAVFSELESDYPNDFLTQLVKAVEHAQLGDYAIASTVLTQWFRTQSPPDPSSFRLAAQYHREAGNRSESQQWFGEYYAAVGNLDRASAHFEEAINSAIAGGSRFERLQARKADIDTRRGAAAPSTTEDRAPE